MNQPTEHEHVHTFVPNAGSRAFANTIKVGLFALGVGMLGSLIFDFHRHTCSSCGNRWRHLGAFNFDDDSAHRCPSCGTQQWVKDV